jgi:Protein of unknown function (DUF3605)
MQSYQAHSSATGDLAKLTRTPSQLRAYQEWSSNTKAQYGSVTNFLLTQRLHWTPLSSSNTDEFSFALANPDEPLTNPQDYLVLKNDWPYGLEPGIFHIVVWTKHRLPVDWDDDGRLTPEGHKLVDDFVNQEFATKLSVQGQDKVIWFKNYGSTSSIRTVDHVHVLVTGVDESEVIKVMT